MPTMKRSLISLLAATMLAAISLTSPVMAAEIGHAATIQRDGTATPWHRDINAAKEAANASGRPILVIFTASWNESSGRFEASLARSIEATTLLTRCFETVRISVADDPWTTRRMGVVNVPAACIIDQQERVLARFDCPDAPAAFIAELCTASNEAAVAATLGATVSSTDGTFSGVAGPVDSVRRGMPVSAPAEPVALDGYCPVSVVTRQSWIKGSPQFSCVHMGRTYRFVSDAERRAFLANPNWYTPALGGDDAVVAAERGQSLAGRRAYAATYNSKLYLFSSPSTLQAFLGNPEQYLHREHVAGRPGSGPRLR
ncbi:MAG: thioredoxin family protein [Planctomycetia bacterium]